MWSTVVPDGISCVVAGGAEGRSVSRGDEPVETGSVEAAIAPDGADTLGAGGGGGEAEAGAGGGLWQPKSIAIRPTAERWERLGALNESMRATRGNDSSNPYQNSRSVEGAPLAEGDGFAPKSPSEPGRMLSSGGLRLLEPGDLIEGKYRINRQIGEGGMGAVFEGEALRIHRRIAVKVLFPHAGAEDDLARRFQLEAQAAGRIGSSHIVEVIDLGTLPSGSHYMVMELLDGESLRSRIQSRGRLRRGGDLPARDAAARISSGSQGASARLRAR